MPKLTSLLPLLSAALFCAAAPAQEKASSSPKPSAPPVLGDYAPLTVVVYNAKQDESKELAAYYAKQRKIPEANLVGLNCSDAETISREDFQTTIEDPLRALFTERKWWELGTLPNNNGGKMCIKTNKRILVLMRGVPLRILEQEVSKINAETGKKEVKTPAAGEQNAASVDSELATLGLLEKPIGGPARNPYFQGTEAFATQPLAPIFLTGRIDGPTKADAVRLIDDAIAVEKNGLLGRVYIDLAQKNDGGYKQGEDWLKNAARTFGLSGFITLVDSRAATMPENYPMRDCAFYLGWYTLPPDGPFKNPGFKFKKGAIACHIHSFSATSVRNATEGWVAPMIKQGAAGILGNVFEPYLSLTAHLDIFSDRLLRGFNLAEAQGMAMPAWSWMSVCIGDPLYRPFAADLEKSFGDAEFRTFRLLVKEFNGPDADKNALLDKLERLASDKKSGTLYEALSMLGMGLIPDEEKEIKRWLQAAHDNFTDPTDKVRVILEQVEFADQCGDKKAAIKLLEDGVKTHAKIPEVACLKERLKQFKP